MAHDETEAGFTPAAPPQGPVLSINQLVSYNLMRARRAQGWTQQDVAELLEKYTGRSWSNASISAAERAWQGGRPRRFDACELVAFSKIFDQPIGFFFLPPEGAEANKWVAMKELEGGDPNRDPHDPENDLMSLLPTADLLTMVGAHEPTVEFSKRMHRLVKRYLGLEWKSASWSMKILYDKERGQVAQLDDVAEEDHVEGMPFPPYPLLSESRQEFDQKEEVEVEGPIETYEGVAVKVDKETGEKTLVFTLTEEELVQAAQKAMQDVMRSLAGGLGTKEGDAANPKPRSNREEER